MTYRRLTLTLSVSLLLAGKVFAQGPPNHKLVVNVVLATTGRPVNSSVRVQLLHMSGTPIAEAYTNHESGNAEFHGGFFEGSYRLQVSGPEIETTTTQLQINPIESEHREYVRVKPLAQATDTIPAAGNQNFSVHSMEVPAAAKVKFEQAMAAYAQGDIDKSRERLQDAIATYPQYARAHNNLGVLYLRENDKVKAREEFAEAIQDDAGLSSAYVNLAKIDVSESKLGDAERELEKAVAVDGSAMNALVMLSSVEYANKEYNKALATISRVHNMAQHEQYGDIHMVAGEIYLQRNQRDRAIAEYELFLKERPNDPRVPKVKDLIARMHSNISGATSQH